jgi:RIO kinase 1
MENKEHNQKIGFYFSKNRRKFDEYRQRCGHDNKIQIKEVRFIDACNQLLSTKEIDKVFSVIGAGKEATVILAQESKTNDLVCAKVYRYFTSTIRKRLKGTKHITKSGMASIVAKQEYWNLVELYNAKIPVPKPRYLIDNIVVMDFINLQDNINQPAPLLSEIDISYYDDPEEVLYESIDILARMFLDAKFIHGDYSDHNLMVTETGLVTMDVSQSVPYNEKTFINTPTRIKIDKAMRLLKADLNNLINSFKKYRITIDCEVVCQEIVDDLPEKLQNFLKESNKMNYFSHYAHERYNAKEAYRRDSVNKLTGKKYQKKKW